MEAPVRAEREDFGSSQPIETLDLLEQLPFCEIRHRGLSIDTGSTWGNAHRSFGVGPFTDVKLIKRAGHSSAAVHSSRLSYDFWLDRATTGVHVGIRAQGDRASRVAVYVDDRRIGQARLRDDASRVHRFGPINGELSPGRHVVTLSFARGRGAPERPLALLDWLWLHLADNIESEYAAPTEANVLQDVELSGTPRRSLGLRSPGSVRCGLKPSPGTRVQLDVGYWGEGEGSVAVRAHLGHQKVVTLAEREVKGGEGATWTPLDLTLDALESDLVVLELVALESTGTGRVVFGEPRLARTLAAGRLATTRNVVVVVASGIARDLIPPWGDRNGQSHLFSLTNEAVTFDGYRVASTLVGGVMASLLTGLPGSRHTLTHSAAELPANAPLIGFAMRQIGGRSALFTGVPYSFEAFGFAHGFSEFDSVSPVKDFGAEEPIERARRWLETEIDEDAERKKLVVVHIRGGHPPWDVTKERAQALAPSEYNGILEPRRGAILLRGVRERSRAASRRLGPRDWERLVTLQREALIKQDIALGKLIELLQRRKQWDETLFVYMGDVARGDEPRIPFEPHGELREDRLSPPLIVKLPGGVAAGQRVGTPIGTLDVSRGLHTTLGLPFPGDPSALDLDALARGVPPLRDQGILAVHPPDFVYTLGRFRLFGSIGETPQLCDLEVDPACHQDLYAESPYLMEWLWRLAFEAFQRQGMIALDTNASMAKIDDDTRAALTVFGL